VLTLDSAGGTEGLQNKRSSFGIGSKERKKKKSSKKGVCHDSSQSGRVRKVINKPSRKRGKKKNERTSKSPRDRHHLGG